MSTTYPRRPDREATSADGARAVGPTSSDHAGQARNAIECLDVLAMQMRARGWTAYISTAAGVPMRARSAQSRAVRRRHGHSRRQHR
jgi:hypothetical protein